MSFLFCSGSVESTPHTSEAKLLYPQIDTISAQSGFRVREVRLGLLLSMIRVIDALCIRVVLLIFSLVYSIRATVRTSLFFFTVSDFESVSFVLGMLFWLFAIRCVDLCGLVFTCPSLVGWCKLNVVCLDPCASPLLCLAPTFHRVHDNAESRVNAYVFLSRNSTTLLRGRGDNRKIV